MRHEKNRPNRPRVQVIVQDKEIGGPVFKNSPLHFGVSSVDNFGTKGFRLAFQLERRFAGGAEVVDGDGVSRSRIEPRGFASGTEKVSRTPRLGAYSKQLGGAFV